MSEAMDPAHQHAIVVALSLTLRFSLALLLGAAAMHKLRDLARFRQAVLDYDVLPAAVARGAAPLIAVLEAALAAALAGGIAVPVAATAVAGLLLAYAGAIHANVARGRTDLDCGCMGPAARVPVSFALVMRNATLAAAAATLAVLTPAYQAHAADVASALAATLALTAAWQASERLFVLAPRAARLRLHAHGRPQ
jgi:uncharacterized membrane protein YphA (DoxX/SURF4 family)